MSEEKKELSQQEGSVEGYFDSLIEDFDDIAEDLQSSELNDDSKNSLIFLHVFTLLA